MNPDFDTEQYVNSFPDTYAPFSLSASSLVNNVFQNTFKGYLGITSNSKTALIITIYSSPVITYRIETGFDHPVMWNYNQNAMNYD